MVSPTRRREAVAYVRRRYRLSERRACRLVGQHRSTQRYTVVPDDFELRLVAAMNRLAETYPRYGYRIIHAMLVTEGWAVNRKRIERLWRLEGHRVPPRRKKRIGNDAKGAAANSIWNLPAMFPNHVWSLDFVSMRTTDGQALRILNVVDDFTRECLGTLVARNIGAGDVKRFLAKLFARHGKPHFLRSDNGREFTAELLTSWLLDQDVEPAPVEKASPQQNAYVERFNGTMRDDLLNGEQFHSVLEARVVIAEWVERYNTVRPHRGLGMKTPAQFAAEWRAQAKEIVGRPLNNPTSRQARSSKAGTVERPV